MAQGWKYLGAAAVAVAVTIGGCGPHKGGDGDKPATGGGGGEQQQEQAPQFRHAQLKIVSDKIQEALQGTGSAATSGPATAAQPDFQTAMTQAARVATSGQWIIDDRPASVPDDQRAKYEGIVEKMKQDAADLQAACDKQQAVKARRSFILMSNACVECHRQFGANGSPAPAPAAPSTPTGGEGAPGAVK